MLTNQLRVRGKKIALTAVLVSIAGLGTGCVSQQSYNELYETNQSLRSQNQQLQNRLGTLESTATQLQGSAGDAQSVIGELRSENTALRDRLNRAQSALSTIEDRMNSLAIVTLDPATDRALADLAARYPDFIIYDAERGMLRFESDLTFASGSDQVQASAAESLERLAQVLTSDAAGQYDLRIVGHTDDEKPSANTQRRHPTNMHLSAHRAISVRNTLGQSGVEWSRMTVQGWGEHRPLVRNNPGAGTPANRRVEVYVVPASESVPLTGSASSESGSVSPQPVETNTRPRIDPTK